MPELFDVVELIMDLPGQGLYAGMQGTIVEIHHGGAAYEVEFSDEDGSAVGLLALRPEQFVVVWGSQSQEEVPLADRIAQLVSRLPEEAAVEVLDFARFLSARTLRSRQEEGPKVGSGDARKLEG